MSPTLVLALAATVVVRSSTAGPPLERGVALGLFSADDAFDYTPLLDELVSVGATHVELTYVWWQDDVAATSLGPLPDWSASDAQVVATARAARARGLHVTVFPIIRLAKQQPGQWRGTLAPRDEDAWWHSYTAMILHAAELARRGGAQRLAIGSELVSRERQRARWVELADRVRVHAPQLELLYSANWDHYRPVSFWDVVDVIGLTGYFELTRDTAASTHTLTTAWAPVVRDLEAWSRELGRPIVLTEVGYPSLDGGAVWPWDQTRRAAVDLEEQRRAYAAFVSAWSGRPFLAGVYFWNWFGFGGAACTDYTPRHKPAADVLARWYAAPRFPPARPSRTREP